MHSVLMDYFLINAWKLDVEALTDYLTVLEKSFVDTGSPIKSSGSRVSDIDNNIIAFLKKYEDAARFQKVYNDTLNSLVDHEKLQKKSDVLHPGFNKLCGLRGSKLSGGQK